MYSICGYLSFREFHLICLLMKNSCLYSGSEKKSSNSKVTSLKYSLPLLAVWEV